MKRKYTIEEKQAHIGKFKTSGLSMSKYATENDIPKTTFADWLKFDMCTSAVGSSGTDDATVSFGTIDIMPSHSSSFSCFPKDTIAFVTDTIKVELKLGYDKALFKKIMDVMLNVE